LLFKEFDRMSGEYGFHVLDASRPLKRIAAALRRSIARLIQETPPQIADAGKPANVSPIARIPAAGAAPDDEQRAEAELREKSA